MGVGVFVSLLFQKSVKLAGTKRKWPKAKPLTKKPKREKKFLRRKQANGMEHMWVYVNGSGCASVWALFKWKIIKMRIEVSLGFLFFGKSGKTIRKCSFKQRKRGSELYK